jgi:hypothetical protein
MLPCWSMPWNPAAITIAPAASSFVTWSVEIDWMRAFVWVESVRMPIWAPVRLTALWPSAWIAIANSATLTCSPVESSMSISRALGRSEICLARSTRTSVWWPIALTTTTTRSPASCRAIALRAAAVILAASATLVPPNFCTTSAM